LVRLIQVDDLVHFRNPGSRASLSHPQRFKAHMATKTTIADLFPDDEGMILVAKDVNDGSPRHITEVQRWRLQMRLLRMR